MSTRSLVLRITFTLLVCGILIVFITSSSSISQEESTATEAEFISKEILLSGKRIPNGWNGLPISYSNKLFIDEEDNPIRFRAGYQSLFKKLIIMNDVDWEMDNVTWEILLTKYESIIGWNGIFDVVNSVQMFLHKDSARRLHYLGEALYNHAENASHAVEVSARSVLHKAPLHGTVWKTIEAIGTSDIQKLFDVVNNDLCWFKSFENMGNIWISCAHGVGHGLAGIYGLHDVESALKVCSSQPDVQFQYACSTGVFMALEPLAKSNEFTPCDTNRFPGACYRFKSRTFSMLKEINFPCDTQSDEYHKIGCIWGSSYVAQVSLSKMYELCEHYLPERNATEGIDVRRHAACIDGFVSAREIGNKIGTIHPDFCDVLLDFPMSFNICENNIKHNFVTFTFKEGDEDGPEMYYNVDILEYDYDPNLPLISAIWSNEWNHFPVPESMLGSSNTDGHAHHQ